jgi:hypothetical protein
MAEENNNFFGQMAKLFGFQLKDTEREQEKKDKLPSPVAPIDEDGSGYMTVGGSHFGHYLNQDGNESKDNAQQIRQYRSVSIHPEVDEAIENITNEAITASEDESSVELILDKTELSENVKKKIQEEFDGIVGMLKFNEHGHDIFRRWYVDGKIYYHLVVDKNKERQGIVDIRPIDAAKMRKQKEIKTKKDPETGAKIIDSVKEYFVYQEKPGQQNSGIRFTQDSISYVTSGLLDGERKKVISHLHKALKPINQLRMMEDSLVIYRMARAPERRIFYIDVGSLPRGKAEQYMKDMMSRYRNKIVYDAESGRMKDDRKHMSMLEDFWLPRREGGRGTEIDTLPGGDNLGQIDDIVYFQKRLYKSLNVPISRLDDDQNPFNIGRSAEVSRDEVAFQKFIDRLRRRFSALFLTILKRQLILKNIITYEDWENIQNDVAINYIRDNHFAELKEGEIWKERFQSLEQVDEFVGKYFSREWVMREILKMSDEDIETMVKQMDAESEDEPDEEEEVEPVAPSAPAPQPVVINVSKDGAKTDSKSK